MNFPQSLLQIDCKVSNLPMHWRECCFWSNFHVSLYSLLSDLTIILHYPRGTPPPTYLSTNKKIQVKLESLRNSSTDFTVVCLKHSITPLRFCTSCCNACLSISAACSVNFNRVASSSARACNSVAFVAWSFDLFSSAVSSSLSDFNCSITVVKLISGLQKFCYSVSHGWAMESTPTIAPRLSSGSLPSAALLDSGARTASNDIPTSWHNSL